MSTTIVLIVYLLIASPLLNKLYYYSVHMCSTSYNTQASLACLELVLTTVDRWVGLISNYNFTYLEVLVGT